MAVNSRGSALCLPVQGDHKGAPLRNNRPNVTWVQLSNCEHGRSDRI